MSRGAWMPMRTFSPMIESTDTSTSSPIMIDWLDLRVSTSIAPPCESMTPAVPGTPGKLPQTVAPRSLLPCHPACHGACTRSLSLVSRPAMSRRSLRPHLNQIRGWVRQGRTDAWIAHQLEVTAQQIQAFKREQGLEPDGDGTPSTTEEIDLRAEDDAAIAAELEAEAARRAEEEAKRAEEEAARIAAGGDEAEEEEKAAPKPRRRSRRGRGRKAGTPLEGTFDHGEEGYGLWLDPDVQ